MEEEKTFVTVFSTNDNALFQVAKTILTDHKIKFFSSGDYLNVLNPAVYESEIQVSEKDEDAARKLLKKITPTFTSYSPSGKFEGFLVKHGILIIAISFLIIMVLFFLLK